MASLRNPVPAATEPRQSGGYADSRPKVLLIGPVPPPEFGVAKAKRLMLDSPVLAKRFRLMHLDTSDTRGIANMGRFDWGNSSLALKHICRLLRTLAREHPDITLLTASQGKLGLLRDAIFVRLARTFHSKVVVHLRGSRYADVRSLEGRMAAHRLRFILKSSALVIVLGNGLVGMAKAVHPRSRVAVIPNGCPPAVEQRSVGRRDSSRPLVIYVGRLGRAKGIEEALTAAGRVAYEVPSLEFVLCGEWESAGYRAEMLSAVERLHLEGVVRFPGPTTGDAKECLFERAWALVVPSHSEGQPWVIIEAMSAGLPVVATDTGAVSETVKDGVSGFVVQVGDSTALAERIAALLTDDDLWKSMAAESLLRYEKLFTIERSHTLLAAELCQVAAIGDALKQGKR